MKPELEKLANIDIEIVEGPKVNAMDYSKFERNVRKFFEVGGYMTIRTDHKNQLPDWGVIDSDNVICFVECKMYTKCVDAFQAIKQWSKCQPRQYIRHMNLVADGCLLDVWLKLYGGKVLILKFREKEEQ